MDDSNGAAEAIRNDILSFNFATPRGEQDVTGIDKSARERLLLLADFSIDLEMAFNDAASPSSHDVFKTVPSTSVARTVTINISGQSLPNEVFFTDYGFTRGADGSLNTRAPGVLSNGTVPTWA